MIHDIFENTATGVQSSLHADDGAIWKREGNILHVIKCIKKHN